MKHYHVYFAHPTRKGQPPRTIKEGMFVVAELKRQLPGNDEAVTETVIAWHTRQAAQAAAKQSPKGKAGQPFMVRQCSDPECAPQ